MVPQGPMHPPRGVFSHPATPDATGYNVRAPSDFPGALPFFVVPFTFAAPIRTTLDIATRMLTALAPLHPCNPCHYFRRSAGSTTAAIASTFSSPERKRLIRSICDWEYWRIAPYQTSMNSKQACRSM